MSQDAEKRKSRAAGARPGAARRPGGGSPQRKRRGSGKNRRGRRIGALLGIGVVLLAILIALGPGVIRRAIRRLAPQRYPVQYQEYIISSAEEGGIPPGYVAAVILAESSYNPKAVSNADTRGLMQILPSTGEWIAGRLGESFDLEALFDPETNIRYGSWYLGYLMDRYHGDMRTSSAAYHAGPTTVDRWLKDPENSEDGLTLKRIPSDVTNTYVDRVLRYYGRYAKIYEEPTETPAPGAAVPVPGADAAGGAG